jgi:hypothetical protein
MTACAGNQLMPYRDNLKMRGSRIHGKNSISLPSSFCGFSIRERKSNRLNPFDYRSRGERGGIA